MRNEPLVIGRYRGSRGRRLATPTRNGRCLRRAILRAVAGAVVLGLLAAGGRWFLTAPHFAVSRVESGPYRFSNRAQVEAALSVCLDRNIWTLSQKDVVAACAHLPWVRDVLMERRLPDTVVVELIEWQPLLAVAVDEEPNRNLYLIGNGRLLALPDHLHPPVLPLLVGLRPPHPQDGETALVLDGAMHVLEVFEALAATGLESTCPVDFVRMTADGFVLVLQDPCGSLLLGHEDFQIRLARYLLARPRIPEGSFVDLRFEDRITFVPSSPARTSSRG
jgi:hypothetical protein